MEYNFREIEKEMAETVGGEQNLPGDGRRNKAKILCTEHVSLPHAAQVCTWVIRWEYIASDIYARYKRLQGFNVLNPMGYDAYGLPAEQYAIQTGQHPAITTVNKYQPLSRATG